MNTTTRSERIKQLAFKIMEDWRRAGEDDDMIVQMLAETIARYKVEKEREKPRREVSQPPLTAHQKSPNI